VRGKKEKEEGIGKGSKRREEGYERGRSIGEWKVCLIGFWGWAHLLPSYNYACRNHSSPTDSIAKASVKGIRQKFTNLECPETPKV